MTRESTDPVIPRKWLQSDSLENPFVVPFTPSKQMKILRAGLTSSSSTLYLVSSSPILADAQVITPQRKQPEPFKEPDWDVLLNPDVTRLKIEGLVHKVKNLQRGLQMAQDCIRAREAVIESAHATNIILELTCQRQQTTLNQKEVHRSEKKDKCALFGDGKAHVITNDDFVLALEEIEERDKVKEEGKEKRKLTCAKAKEFKEARRKAWERALGEWKEEREAWEEECGRLVEAGTQKKDLPKAPKRPLKADVLLVTMSSEGNEKSDVNGTDVDEDGTDDEEDDDREDDSSEGE